MSNVFASRRDNFLKILWKPDFIVFSSTQVAILNMFFLHWHPTSFHCHNLMESYYLRRKQRSSTKLLNIKVMTSRYCYWRGDQKKYVQSWPCELDCTILYQHHGAPPGSSNVMDNNFIYNLWKINHSRKLYT